MKKFGNTYYSESTLKSGIYLFSESKQLYEEREIKSQSENNSYDIFLSHSSRDKPLITNLRKVLLSRGYSVYIDWIEDSELGRKEISPKLKTAMSNSKIMVYVHTYNSENSKWTPWEIGYFDSKKGSNRVGVMPILSMEKLIASYSGQEYLEQYTQIGADYLDEFIR